LSAVEGLKGRYAENHFFKISIDKYKDTSYNKSKYPDQYNNRSETYNKISSCKVNQRGFPKDKAEVEIKKIIKKLREANVNRLPTESELMARLNLGRHSIREAISRCVSEGLLEKVQGKGTFIITKTRELDFLGWIGTEPPGDMAIEKMVEGFESKNPDIKLNYHPVPYYQTIDRMLKLSFKSKSPDVIQITPAMLGFLHDLDYVIPLDKYINHNHLTRRYPVDIESTRIDKQIYAITWALSPLILYYNKRVLEKVGLDPEKPPTTLEELEQMCFHINNSKRENTWGISLPLSINDPIFLWLYPYFLSFNGGFLDRIGNIIIDCEQNVHTLNWIINLHENGGVPGKKDVTEGRMLFASDHIAFWIDGPWLKGIFREISSFRGEFDTHYGVAKIPIGPSGKSESVLWNHLLAITQQCQDVEAANKWIEYLVTNEEVLKHYYEVMGMLPPMRDVLNKEMFIRDSFASVFIAQMETASHFPIANPLFTNSVPFISQVISDVIAGRKDPEQKLKFLKEIINMIKQNAFLSIFAH